MADTPKRRWFQFRLRTLLVGVLLLAIPCAYVAHEYHIVATRRAWIAQYKPHFSTVSTRWGSGNPENAPSLIRRLLGDQQYYTIALYNGESRDMPDVERLFPEAFVYVEMETRALARARGEH